MKYLVTLATLLPAILAGPIGYEFNVNLLTTIKDLSMVSPSGTNISYSTALEHREYHNDTLSVIGNMTFTETDIPQSRKVKFGGIYSDMIIEVKDPAGVREADAEIIFLSDNQPNEATYILAQWASDVPPGFNASVTVVFRPFSDPAYHGGD